MAACRQHRQLVLLAATRNGGLVVSRPSALFSRSAEGALCSSEKPFSLRPHRGLGIISPEGSFSRHGARRGEQVLHRLLGEVSRDEDDAAPARAIGPALE